MDNELRVPYNNTNSAPFYSSKFSKNPFIKPAEAAEKFWSTDKFEWWFQIGLKYTEFWTLVVRQIFKLRPPELRPIYYKSNLSPPPPIFPSLCKGIICCGEEIIWAQIIADWKLSFSRRSDPALLLVTEYLKTIFLRE